MKTFLFCISCLVPFVISANTPLKIVEGNNTFAFKLYKEVYNTSGKNLFFSPFSISTALAMTYAGAHGTTALQMSQTMNFQPGKDFHSDFKKLLDGLNEDTAGKIKLNIANGLWAQKDFTFLDSYFELTKRNYKPEIKNVNFKDDLERESIRKEINAWVEQKTNDKIQNLLGSNDLDTFTRLILVNAIYFYGDWAVPFLKESTQPKAFTLPDGTQSRIPFMNQNGGYRYFEDSAIQAIEIPYRGNKASMVIFLPNKISGLTEFEKSFDFNYYKKIIAGLNSNQIRLSLPKFQATCKFELGNTLSRMGMPLAFSKTHADFSGMTGKPDLYISKVIHQAFINVDEKGTEAAAATAVTMTLMMATPPRTVKVFNADHPFIFLIKDNTTGSILFMGKILNPEVPR